MKSVLTLPADHCTVATIHEPELTNSVIIEAIGKQLEQAAKDADHRLVVNFFHVDRCSSSVLGKLVALRRKIMNARGRLTLCCCSGNMLEALKVTGLRRLFDVFDSEPEAIEFMRQDVVAWKPGAEL